MKRMLIALMVGTVLSAPAMAQTVRQDDQTIQQDKAAEKADIQSGNKTAAAQERKNIRATERSKSETERKDKRKHKAHHDDADHHDDTEHHDHP